MPLCVDKRQKRAAVWRTLAFTYAHKRPSVSLPPDYGSRSSSCQGLQALLQSLQPCDLLRHVRRKRDAIGSPELLARVRAIVDTPHLDDKVLHESGLVAQQPDIATRSRQIGDQPIGCYVLHRKPCLEARPKAGVEATVDEEEAAAAEEGQRGVLEHAA